MTDHVQSKRAEDLVEAPGTPGLVRRTAFEGDGHWFGHVEAEANSMSGWHHHGENTTMGYSLKGSFRVEYGPGGGRWPGARLTHAWRPETSVAHGAQHGYASVASVKFTANARHQTTTRQPAPASTGTSYCWSPMLPRRVPRSTNPSMLPSGVSAGTR